MGFSHSFIAARGVARDALLEQLGLDETAETGDVEIALSGFGLTQGAGGWFIVACDDFEFPQEAPLLALSEAGEVVSCRIEEHVMFSEAQGFSAGALAWRVTHDPDRGESLFDLRVEGVPPAAFAELRDKILAKQEKEGGEDAGADYVFDVPPRTAESVCGFFFGESEGRFVRLNPVHRQRKSAQPRSGKPGLFARLFGRG